MTKSPLLVLSAAALGITALTGCGSGGVSQAAQNKSSKPAATATATSTPAAATGGPVNVDLSEWAVKPSATTVKAGKVTFDVANQGKTTHEMVVLRTTKPANKLGTGSRIKEVVHVGEEGDLAPGASKKLTLKLKPGHYSLVCNLPGHYMSGMHADLTVQ